MRFNDSVTLRSKTYERTPDGSQVESVEDREVFCNRMAIGLAARLAGGAEGLRGAVRVRVRAGEYGGEQFAVLDGREMTVDSASSNGEWATLTLTERLGGAGGGRGGQDR